jgi:hypothetical protein
MAGTEKLFMMTEEKRNQLVAGFDLTKMASGEAPLWADARRAPRHIQIRIAEIREAISEKRAVQGDLRTYPAPSEEYRRAALSFQQKAKTRGVTPLPARRKSLEDIYFEQHGHEFHTIQDDVLRQKADLVLRQIRRDERLAEQHFIATASPAELLKALDAKCGRSVEQPGAALSPGAPCCNACTPEQHARAATYHRTKGQKADNWQRGAAHFGAADAHARAAAEFNADNSVAARAASQKVFDDFEDEEDEDNF